MSMDNVQLKQESVVGNDAVLSDINPKTNTLSVEDAASGEQLNKILTEIWNAINNKVARQVNSVNGRTGVVVLTSEDVGLGNVDNISFTDMKNWIIDLIDQYFKDKKLNLFPSFIGVTNIYESNDKSFAWSPFYCDTFDDSDQRAVIGYFTWDESLNHLGYAYAMINTLGYSKVANSMSILYNESAHGVDMTGGGIAVNIHPDEEALKIWEGQNGKNDSGLMIDASAVRGAVYAFPCLYGQYNSSDPQNPRRETALLSITPGGFDSVKVTIYINGSSIPGGFWLTTENGGAPSFHPIQTGDVILTQFDWYGPDENVIQQYTNTAIMGRQPAFGIVTSAPNKFYPDREYVIKFYTMKPRATFGLQYLTNHQNLVDKYQDSELTISLLGYDFGGDFGVQNLSGINAAQPFDKTSPLNPDNPISLNYNSFIRVEMPWGGGSLVNWPTHFKDGLAITSDPSLCSSPDNLMRPQGKVYLDLYSKAHDYSSDPGAAATYAGCAKFTNYAVTMDTFELGDNRASMTPDLERRRLGSLSQLMVKTQKILRIDQGATELGGGDTMTLDAVFSAFDISGLRIGTYFDYLFEGSMLPRKNLLTFDDRCLKMLGIYDGFDAVGEPVRSDYQFASTSGGLQINVGKFLEIRPQITAAAVEYNNGGKVQVRIGKGLKEDFKYEEYTDARFDPNEPWDNYSFIVNDNGTPSERLGVPVKYFLLTSEPSYWDEAYTEFWMDDGHGQGNMMHVPVSDPPPTWVADTYYVLRYLTKAESIAFYADAFSVDPSDVTCYYRNSTNRITLNLDSNTLDFNEDGQLTVVGGVGGSGSNVRFTDTRGFYFDTVPQTNPNVPVHIDEVVFVGRGLCIRGGNCPKDVYVNIAKLRKYLLEMIDENICLHAIAYALTSDPSRTAMTLYSCGNSMEALRTLVASCENLADMQSYYAAWDEALQYADAMIAEYGNERLYLVGNRWNDVEVRIDDILYNVVDKMAEPNRAALMAMIIDHYNVDGDTIREIAGYLKQQVNIAHRDVGPPEVITYPLDWFFDEFLNYIIDPSTIPEEFFTESSEQNEEPQEEET